MCGLRYGSAEAAVRRPWMAGDRARAPIGQASISRARRAAFPLFDSDAYLAAGHVASLPPDIRDGIAKHGIRNALLTSIAPTGTISLFAGNVSSGIEPIFSIAYERKVLMPDGSKRSEEVEDYAARPGGCCMDAMRRCPLPSSPPMRSRPMSI